MVMVLICLAAMLAIPASARTDLPTVISQAKEGVVKLFVVGFSPDDTPAAAAVGSGFAVGQKGSTPEYFVTNWHVASAYLSEYNYAFDSDHVRIWIMLDNFTISDVTGLPSEATSVECSIVRISESGYPDYAILRAARPVTECKPLPIRSSESVKQGETVVALGCPAVVDDLSATVGSNDITATRGTVARHMVMSAAGNTNVLLHDAVISGGNSGGPLFNMDGEVVGINSQIFSTSGGFMGLSFAIPIDLALQIKDQLVKHGKVTRGRIGVMIQNITPELAESFGLKTPKGAIVAQIDKSGPAAKSDLREGDVITAVNGKPVETSGDMPVIVGSLKPGDTAKLTVIRDGKSLTVKVAESGNDDWQPGQKSSAKASALGVTVRALNEEEKQQAETEGLLVVKSEGAARKAGIQSGDIIVNVNGIAMKKSTDLGNILEKSKTLRILIQRGGTRIFIPIRLK